MRRKTPTHLWKRGSSADGHVLLISCNDGVPPHGTSLRSRVSVPLFASRLSRKYSGLWIVPVTLRPVRQSHA
eukprot:1246841-Pleurochrysis_carterae.AAC.1